MICPICKKKATHTKTGNEAGDDNYAMLVVELLNKESCCWDSSVQMYVCPENHTFYVSDDAIGKCKEQDEIHDIADLVIMSHCLGEKMIPVAPELKYFGNAANLHGAIGGKGYKCCIHNKNNSMVVEIFGVNCKQCDGLGYITIDDLDDKVCVECKGSGYGITD